MQVGNVVYRNNLAADISSLGTQFALGRPNPLITKDPVDLIVCENTNPVFTVTATGAEPLTYLWFKDGVPVINGPHYSGARSNTLTIINAVLSDAGNYYCIVRDRYLNSTTTKSAHLTVNKIPVATVSPSAQDNECSNVAFDDIVLGESYGVPGTTFIWSRDNPFGITSLVPMTGTPKNIGDAFSGSFTNSTDAPVKITFTITPVGPSTTFCTGIPITATVTVNPTPRIIPVMSQICYGASTNIKLVSPSTMTQPDVIRFNYDIVATALPAIVAGNRIPATSVGYGTILKYPYTNESDTLQSVYYKVTPTVTALGCPSGNEVAFEVKVHPKPLRGVIITKPLTCEGGSDASLKAFTAKGTGPYYFNWRRNSRDSVVGYSIPEITGQKGGYWDITVRDNLLCSNQVVNFRVQGAVLDPFIYATIDTSGYGTTCAGSNDGLIQVRANNTSSGVLPYDYWVVRNDQDTVIQSSFTALAVTDTLFNMLPGKYTMYMTDANECASPGRSVSILAPDVITATFTKPKGISCTGYDDGSVIATVAGGNGKYRYKWTTVNGLINETDTLDHLDHIPAGTYHLDVTDIKGCSNDFNVDITDPPGMTLSSSEISVTADGNFNVSCNGGNDGWIKMNITGGSGNYLYSWTDSTGYSASTKDISGLRAGTYTCLVKDQNGCDLTPSPIFTLKEPAPLGITSTSSSCDYGGYNINCSGGTGSIVISITGGSTGNYSYTWNTSDGSGIVQGQKDQLSLTAGTYTVSVTDMNMCSIGKTITLTQPLPLVTNLNKTDLTCTQPGKIDLTPSGGVEPYTYLWSNGAVTKDIPGLTPGKYIVTVTDANSCVKTDSAIVSDPPPLTYIKSIKDFNGYNISCFGKADGQIGITTTSGALPYDFTWTFPDGSIVKTPEINNLVSGQYMLKIVDKNECTASEIITLTEPGKIGLNFNLSSSTFGGYNINCAGDSTGYYYRSAI